MKIMKLPSAAALMLGVSAVAMPVVVAAQQKDEMPAASEKSKSSEPSTEQRSNESGQKGQDKQNAADRGEQKQKDRAAEKGDSDRSKDGDKQKSADREDKDRGKRGDQPKQSDRQSDPSPSKKADTDKSSDKKSDSANAPKPADAPKEAARQTDDRKKSASDDTKQGGSAKVQEAKNADLSGDKKDRVKSAFKSTNVKQVTNVDIDISVGRRLPRDWHYHPIPAAVIEIVPEYRGYHYVYVEDRYVIVDPDSYEVVYVFDEGGSASVGRSTGESGSARGTCETDLTFTTEDRRFIFEKVRTSADASIKIGDLTIGASLPGEARVKTFPSEVVTRVSRLDGCRYVVVEDRIAVIDPNGDKIVAIIED
jgi:hypothetical protein